MGSGPRTLPGVGEVGADDEVALALRKQQADRGMGFVLDQLGVLEAEGPAVILGQPDVVAFEQAVGGDDLGGKGAAHWMASCSIWITSGSDVAASAARGARPRKVRAGR